MQTCKLLPLVVGLFVAVPLFAESMEMPQMPQMPTVSDMPQVSIPTLDNDFYKPTMPANPAKPKKPESDVTADTSLNETILTDATTTDDLLSTLLTNSSTLTAKDISSLYDSGLFTDVTSLGSSSLTSGLYDSSSTSAATNVLLQQVLNSLNDMKAEQKKNTVAQQEALNDAQTDLQTFKKREPSILRFKINGYNIADSLTTTFFSEPDSDGTFLLTADRKYYADGKNRTETFYLLFKAVKNSGSSVSYEVQPSIVQDYKNENSFIYRMTNQKKLTAEKTGNLVVLHQEGELNLDLLVNIDK